MEKWGTLVALGHDKKLVTEAWKKLLNEVKQSKVPRTKLLEENPKFKSQSTISRKSWFNNRRPRGMGQKDKIATISLQHIPGVVKLRLAIPCGSSNLCMSLVELSEKLCICLLFSISATSGEIF